MAYTLFKGAWMSALGVGRAWFDLLTVFTALLYAFRGAAPAGVFAICQGAFVDAFSGGASGVFCSLYLLVCGGIAFGSRFFDLGAVKGQILIVVLAVFLRETLFLLMIPLFSAEALVPVATWGAAAISAVVSGLGAPLFFAAFQRMAQAAGIPTEEGVGEEI